MKALRPILAGTLLVVACTSPLPWLQEAPVPPVSENERLLAYFDWAQRLPASELAREREITRRALSDQKSDLNRLRYALALAVPGGGADDAAQALDVLDPVVRNRDSPQHTLAVMLRALLSDLRKAEAEQAELRRKLESLKALEKSLSGREGEKR